MAATNFGNSLWGTGISVSGLASLGIGAVGTGAQFANPLLGTATGSYPTYGDLVLVLGTSITTVAGSPNLQAVLLESDTSGGASEIARVSSSQIFPADGMVQKNLIPSFAYTTTELIVIKGIWWWSSPYLTLAVLNNSGVALPSTLTATLYPYGGAAG